MDLCDYISLQQFITIIKQHPTTTIYLLFISILKKSSNNIFDLSIKKCLHVPFGYAMHSKGRLNTSNATKPYKNLKNKKFIRCSEPMQPFTGHGLAEPTDILSPAVQLLPLSGKRDQARQNNLAAGRNQVGEFRNSPSVHEMYQGGAGSNGCPRHRDDELIGRARFQTGVGWQRRFFCGLDVVFIGGIIYLSKAIIDVCTSHIRF